jgi:uncharacterized protein
MNLLSIYQKPENVKMLHSRYYVEGALFGAGVSPEIPMPDIWLTWAIKHNGKMQNNQQADEITDALFEYFKHCLQLMKDNKQTLPDYCYFDSAVSKDDSKARLSPLSQWLQGVLMAHSSMEPVWQNAWKLMQSKAPDKAPILAKKLKHSLSMFTTFADIALAKEQAAQRGQTNEFENNLPVIAKSLPDALNSYVLVSGTLAEYLPNQFETFTI